MAQFGIKLYNSLSILKNRKQLADPLRTKIDSNQIESVTLHSALQWTGKPNHL